MSGSLVKVVEPDGPGLDFGDLHPLDCQGVGHHPAHQFVPETGHASTAQSSFSIIKATGAFQGDVGTGTATLKTITQAVPVVPPTMAQGVFTLTLKSNTAAV